MIRKLLLIAAGLVLAVAGLIGLVLPVLPGVLPLVGALACFSLASSRFRQALETRLERHPRYRAAWRRWQASGGLPAWRRAQVAVLLTARSVLPQQRQ